MEPRTLGGIAAGALILVALWLAVGLSSLPGRLRAEFRPPFKLAGPLDFLRLDYYTAPGRVLIAKAASSLALLSFIIVAGSWLAVRFPSSAEAPKLGEVAVPPDFIFVIASAMAGAVAAIALLVFAVGAVLQFGWALRSQSDPAHRLNAGRFAIYAVGALLVWLAHNALFLLGQALLK